MELSHLYAQLERNNRFYKLKYDDSYPGVRELQQYLTKDEVVINFYTSAEKLHVFLINRESIQHLQIDSLPVLEKDIMAWLRLLKTTESGRKFKGQQIGNKLYERLIYPITKLTPDNKEWIIIPDGKLYFLPFESIPVLGSSRCLVESKVISYQLSSRFITNDNQNKISSGYSVLAFAPFSNKPPQVSSGKASISWNGLPASLEEIKDLQGLQFSGKSATKAQFLQLVNSFPVVHLATHAVADVQNTGSSFIAFYPQNNSVLEDRLYLEELYGLKMDATKLIIISACETGDGELVNNEGVISLARGFAYAGCASSVNSLWKADDIATSEILRSFHGYLQKGYTKSKALQLAKIDYIRSGGVSKNPGHWSNLILVGDSSPICETELPYKWFLISSCMVLLLFAALRRRKKKSTQVLN
jgi:CHAT domain-containing protein